MSLRVCYTPACMLSKSIWQTLRNAWKLSTLLSKHARYSQTEAPQIRRIWYGYVLVNHAKAAIRAGVGPGPAVFA
jgi:hypothetical protein